jgi:hypothetical protein
MATCIRYASLAIILHERANGLRYLRVGGLGFCSGAGKNSTAKKILEKCRKGALSHE